MKRIEIELLDKIQATLGKQAERLTGGGSLVRPTQFFGIDIKPFAVELAKVGLVLGKKLALDEAQAQSAAGDHLFWHLAEPALPLDNLDANIRCNDALFCDWPQADAITGGSTQPARLAGDATCRPLPVATSTCGVRHPAASCRPRRLRRASGQVWSVSA